MTRSRRLPPFVATLAAFAASLVFATPAGADVDRDKLQKLHAAFVLNFMKFTAWPDAPADRPLRVVVLGQRGVADALSAAARGRQVQGRPVLAEPAAAPPAADADRDVWNAYLDRVLSRDVVYAPADRPAALRRLTAAAAGRPVLVVADRPAGIAAGSMLAFDLQDGRVIFHAGRRALAASGVTVKAPLLKLARMHD